MPPARFFVSCPGGAEAQGHATPPHHASQPFPSQFICAWDCLTGTGTFFSSRERCPGEKFQRGAPAVSRLAR